VPKELIPFLLEALKGEEYTPTQGYAEMVLASRGGPDAVEALERARDDEREDPALRERAAKLLKRMNKGTTGSRRAP
jgi:hypothetical protein